MYVIARSATYEAIAKYMSLRGLKGRGNLIASLNAMGLLRFARNDLMHLH